MEKLTDKKELCAAIECILFVSGDPVSKAELCRVFSVDSGELEAVLNDMAGSRREREAGVLIDVTDETVQFVSNKKYAPEIEELLQPAQSKTISQSMLETLSIVAYRQPVTRSEIEAIRGVRCEYSVSQLLRQGLIGEGGRKDTVGKPMMFVTTDKFLRKFGLHSIEELPEFSTFSQETEAEAITV